MAKIFITGGISSGKSSFAEETALSLYKSAIATGGRQVLSEKNRASLHFIATAGLGGENEYEDAEMDLKIEKHKERRDRAFTVHENFVELQAEIDGIRKSLSSESGMESGVVLIDSMTLWLASIFKNISGYDSALESVIEFSELLSKIECSVVTVADSLGFNMVPVDVYARKFIELNGLMEQELSAVSDKAYCVIAGNPVALK